MGGAAPHVLTHTPLPVHLPTALAGPTPDGVGASELWIQRFGADPENGALTVNVWHDALGKNGEADPGAFHKLLDLPRAHGITRDEATVSKVRAHIQSNLKAWPPMYAQACEAIEAVRILPLFMHPFAKDTEAKAGTEDLPVMMIGDALHALPPWSGMSGNYALSDASDLATALMAVPAGKSLAPTLREKEAAFLSRADEPRERCVSYAKHQIEYLKRTPWASYNMFESMLGGNDGSGWGFGSRWSIVGYFRILTWLNAFEGYGIRVPPTATKQNTAST